jgi:CRISPR-associated protein Cas2
MFSIIVYDIEDNKKRNKIAKLLEKHGERVQKSVFECDLRKEQIDNLKNSLASFEYTGNDSIRLYHLEASSVKRVERIGGTDFNLSKDFYLV